MPNLVGPLLVSVGRRNLAGGFGCQGFLDGALVVALLFAASTVIAIVVVIGIARRRRDTAAMLGVIEAPRVEIVGVGAMLKADGDGLLIEQVIPGGGAEAAALAPGDVILAVGDGHVGALGIDRSIQNIRGPEGSTVRLTVRRATGEVVEVTATRRRTQA